ncbi:helix-turn-helix domain-containing protein [Bacillus phage PK1]|nr:helix-turn-helix domain-containing protein [Bacillus phage PK1]
MAKVSAYRTGEPRFGLRDPKPHDYSVKTSFLSPEELEKYRNGEKGGSKMTTYKDYLKMKEEGHSNNTIAQKMGISQATLYNRIKVWKLQEVNVETPVENKVAETLNQQDKMSEYRQLIDELSNALEAEKKSGQEKDAVREKLENKIKELEKGSGNINAACEDLEEEVISSQVDNKKLKEQNRILADKLHSAAFKIRSLESDLADKQSDINHLTKRFKELQEAEQIQRKLIKIWA